MSPVEILALVGLGVVLAAIAVRPATGLLALIVYTPLIDSVPRLPIAGMNGETALFSLLVAMTLIRFGPRLPPLRYSGPVIAYVLVLVVAWLVGASYQRGLEGRGFWDLFKGVKSMSFPCLFFVFAYWWTAEVERRRAVLEALVWSGTLAAVAGLVDYLAPFTVNGMMGRATGFMQDPNSLGGYLAVTTLAAPVLLRDAGLGRARRALYLALYALGLLVTVLSLSRAAWVGILLGHAVALYFLSPRLLFATVAAAALALPVSYPLLPELIRNRVQETFQTRSTVYVGAEGFGAGADRIIYYRIGATMLAESPIWGHGMDSFVMMTPKYGARYGMLSNRASHSVLVKLAAESGLLGLAMLGWLSLTIGLLGWRLARGGGPDAALGIALLAGTASISAANLFQVTFIADHAIASTLWILFGVATRARVDARWSRRAAAPVGWRARLLEASAAQPAGLAARNVSTSS